MAAPVTFPMPQLKSQDVALLPIIGDGQLQYATWRSRFRSSLALMDMIDVVDVAYGEDGAVEFVEAELARFQLKDRKLFAILEQKVKGADSGLRIEADNSGRRLWHLLELAHAEEEEHQRDLLLAKMDALQWPAHEDAATFSMKFMQILTDLSDVNHFQEFQETRRKLLAKLPRKRYEVIWSELRAVDTVQGMFQRLQIHDQEFRTERVLDVAAAADFHDRRDMRSQPVHDGRSDYRGGQRGGAARGRGRGRYDRVRCDHCKELGHPWKQCPKLQRDMEIKRRGEPTSGRRANAVEDYDYADDAAAVVQVLHLSDETMASALLVRDPHTGAWCVDSGASSCMTHLKNELSNYRELPKGSKRVAVADNATIPVLGMGDMTFRALSDKNELVTFIKRDVYHVPDLRLRLLSTGACTMDTPGLQFVDAGAAGGELRSTIDGWVVPLRRRGNLLWLDVVDQAHVTDAVVQGAPMLTLPASDTVMGGAPIVTAPATAPVLSPDAVLLHERLGHPCDRVMVQATRVSMASDTTCTVCALAKSRHAPVPHAVAVTQPLRPGSVIAVDIMGPIRTPTFAGGKYALAFVDRASRAIVGAYVMKTKDEASDFMVKLAADAPQLTNQAVRLGLGVILQTDDDSVFRSIKFRTMCAKYGVQLRCSAPYLSAQNGLIERIWGTIMPRIRALLIGGHLPDEFWGLAFKHAVALYNMLPHSALDGVSPLQAATGIAPDLSVLRVFGAVTFAVLPIADRTKLAPVARQGVWVGYQPLNQCDKVYLADTRVVIEVPRPKVDEREAVRGGAFRTTPRASDIRPAGEADEIAVAIDVPAVHLPDVAPTFPSATPDTADDYDQPAAMWASEALATAFAAVPDGTAPTPAIENPTSVAQAFSGPQAAQWKAGIRAEFATQKKNRTWDLIPVTEVPPGAQIFNPVVVFRLKFDGDGVLLTGMRGFKVRICVQGFIQRPDSVGGTFAAVTRLDSVRMALAVAAQLGWSVSHADVVSAFLNVRLPEPRYMRVPPGVDAVDDNGTPVICRVYNALNGFIDSPRLFAQHLTSVLLAFGFQRCVADPCVYVRARSDDSSAMILAVWVDDLLAVSPTHADATTFFAALNQKLPVVDEGPVKWYLGMAISISKAEIKITQTAYVRGLMQRVYGLDAAGFKPVDTPFETGTMPRRAQLGDDMIDATKYRALVGALLYVTVCTRPDVAFAVGQLARHMAAPTADHWTAATRVTRYLVTTADEGITYQIGSSMTLSGYADASYATDEDTRRSVGAAVFFVAGGPIAWRSRTQAIVSLSSTEAEYIALCEAAQDSVFLRRVYAAMTGGDEQPVLLREDSQPCIALASDPTLVKRASRHVQVKYHFIRQCVADGSVRLRNVASVRMVADILTKALPRPQFRALRALLLGPVTEVDLV